MSWSIIRCICLSFRGQKSSRRALFCRKTEGGRGQDREAGSARSHGRPSSASALRSPRPYSGPRHGSRRRATNAGNPVPSQTCFPPSRSHQSDRKRQMRKMDTRSQHSGEYRALVRTEGQGDPVWGGGHGLEPGRRRSSRTEDGGTDAKARGAGGPLGRSEHTPPEP